MWKYLIYNAAWFSLLFLACFSDRKTWRALILLLLVGTGAVAIFQKGMDPFSVFFYGLFSWLTYWSAFQFRHWVYGRLNALEEETIILNENLEEEKSRLEEDTRFTEAFNQQSNEISDLYEKMKEMSQSLDNLRTFFVLGEALTRFFHFESLKLAFFDDENPDFSKPQEFFEIKRSDFEGSYDRDTFLKDRKKTPSHPLPSDEKIFQWVFEHKKDLEFPMVTAESVAYPVFIHEKIVAVLTLFGIEESRLSMVSLLAERFILELQRIKLYHKVETLAITDGLTRVMVRRYLLERLEGEIHRCKRFGVKLSFLMIDIDHFKNFNDQHGHLVGDVVLKHVAETVMKNTRELDLVGRYGGEEFGVLLVDTDESGAFFVAERILRAVSESVCRAYDEELKVTVSIGCATYSESLNETNFLVDAADSALYQAKRQGRNRVCSASLAE